MTNISLVDAAKIVLGKTLYYNATVDERRKGLFDLPPQDNFLEAVILLRAERKRNNRPDDQMIDSIGMAIVPAAIRLVEVWDASGKDWLK